MSTIPPDPSVAFSFTSYPPGGDHATVLFRAHLTDISDSYASQWSENMDMGRADPKFMYSSYSRQISLNFMVIEATKTEHNKNTWYKALNRLSNMTKPVYRKGVGFNGVMVQLVVGNLINEKGFLESVDFSWDNESPWKDGRPMYISVSVGFRVVGDTRPAYSAGSGGGLGNRKADRGSDSFDTPLQSEETRISSAPPKWQLPRT